MISFSTRCTKPLERNIMLKTVNARVHACLFTPYNTQREKKEKEEEKESVNNYQDTLEKRENLCKSF